MENVCCQAGSRIVEKTKINIPAQREYIICCLITPWHGELDGSMIDAKIIGELAVNWHPAAIW